MDTMHNLRYVADLRTSKLAAVWYRHFDDGFPVPLWVGPICIGTLGDCERFAWEEAYKFDDPAGIVENLFVKVLTSIDLSYLCTEGIINPYDDEDVIVYCEKLIDGVDAPRPERLAGEGAIDLRHLVDSQLTAVWVRRNADSGGGYLGPIYIGPGDRGAQFVGY